MLRILILVRFTLTTMPGCAAIGCSKRADQGYLMKIFPKDPQRRREWAVRTKRNDWTPTDRSVLCEVHFEPEMWEKTREDGKRKLKCNAVPTLFSFAEPKLQRKPRKERVTLVEDINLPNTSDQTESISTQTECSAVSTAATELIDIKSVASTENKTVKSLELKLRNYERHYRKLSAKYGIMKKELRKFKVQLKAAQNDDNLKILKTIFNDDQITALKRSSTKFMKWSNATVENALKLKFVCGTGGYQELLNQKYPLPSLRTLRARF